MPCNIKIKKINNYKLRNCIPVFGVPQTMYCIHTLLTSTWYTFYIMLSCSGVCTMVCTHTNTKGKAYRKNFTNPLQKRIFRKDLWKEPEPEQGTARKQTGKNSVLWESQEQFRQLTGARATFVIPIRRVFSPHSGGKTRLDHHEVKAQRFSIM